MPHPVPLAPFPWFDLVIILALVALNGLFAMSELAIVSARKARMEAMARAGRRGARTAIDLAADPSKFLSTVQIGITLIGILAGAYSGASLGGPVGERLALLGVPAESAEEIGFGLVIVVTTFLSLIIGELVPKQFALRAPEPIAAVMAVPMLWLSRATAPFVWLLDRTSALIFRLLGLTRESENHVTAEELHLIVAEASSAGVIEESERAIISGVVRLADRPVREVMTPRTEVEWIDINAGPDDIRGQLAQIPHTRMPVADGSVDQMLGVIHARDLVGRLLRGEPIDLRAMLRKAIVLPDHVDAMDALKALREAEVPMAFVHDEYGHFEGLVAPANLLAAIAGEFASDQDEDTDPPIVEREDGSWLISGAFAADTMADRLGIDLPEDRDFATAAGFALWRLKHLPQTGESFVHKGLRFEVVDMDGRRIDKLLVSTVNGED
ncbi:hemolysin family protein [Rhizorhabdus dicambivorans]|uniref:HlyC/CorC family transporter n=1 Tax=Rhizorhabdus dicambivorans TaxID=1850238 RepID=A0A2A4FZY7_9SPHN|nr:hemolysin family protein [Rhizorhabdus dicambivorans]ATE66727.1 HlyC/CorC family transporter [Rhizorhabdus dicambivorans]PCE43786.1 HlyC/CorC family transporter [Rhizorhabdus dicambivorans]